VKRAPGGRARVFLAAKVSPGALAVLREQADAECDGNVSELVRRMLKYSLTHTPKGWKG